MLQLLITNLHEYCDAPRPWGLYFQDSAAPQMEGLVELHDNCILFNFCVQEPNSGEALKL
jgi:cytochrome c oxidase subunit 2